MASKAVQDAIEARLQTWSNLSSCPLADFNEVGTSPRAAFLQIEYPFSEEERIPITAPPALYRETGGIRFVLNIRIGTPLDNARTWVDELRDIFRDKDDFTGVPDLQTEEASPALFDKDNRRGAFWQVPFVVLYHYDYVK